VTDDKPLPSYVSSKIASIRSYTPSQLMDDIDGRDDCDDYHIYVYSSGAGREVSITHHLTGLNARCGDYDGVFRNKREAWAQLQEQLAKRES
jgi:hypothetical protein